MLSEGTRTEIIRLGGRYPYRRSALLPALYLVQDEQGYVSEEAMVEVGDLLQLTPADVKSVASYYTMFFKKPIGRHTLDICTNLACKARNAEAVVTYVCTRLHVELGNTTADGRFYVQEVECLGQCDLAPVIEVDMEPLGPLDTPESIDRALAPFT